MKRKKKEEQKDQGTQAGAANRERQSYLRRRKKSEVNLAQIHLFWKGNLNGWLEKKSWNVNGSAI